MSFLRFMNDSGVVGWLIFFTGMLTLFLIIERVKVLFFEYNVNADDLMTKINNHVLAKKPEEALILCSQLHEKPLARALKGILEKADRDDDTIFQAHDVALSEVVPLYTKKLHYLSMLANVATLMGLLGTIHGLILSFQAVAQADPASKQALLANGISVSMYTTALGLAVAIPAMIAFSILTSRQNLLLEQLTEKTQKLTELLTTQHMPALTKNNVFPDNNQQIVNLTPPTPPSTSIKKGAS